MRRVRSHLTYANVISTLCLFLLLTGGTAVALRGKNSVQSNDIGPGAQVKKADVVNDSLTGADIKNKSGVDTCVNTVGSATSASERRTTSGRVESGSPALRKPRPAPADARRSAGAGDDVQPPKCRPDGVLLDR